RASWTPAITAYPESAKRVSLDAIDSLVTYLAAEYYIGILVSSFRSFPRRNVGGPCAITFDSQTKAVRFRATKSGIDSGGSPVTFSTTSLVPANTPFW